MPQKLPTFVGEPHHALKRCGCARLNIVGRGGYLLSRFLRRLKVSASRKSNRLRRIAEPVSAALQRVRLPPLTDKKSTLNCYYVTSVDICLAVLCAGCRLLHAAKATACGGLPNLFPLRCNGFAYHLCPPKNDTTFSWVSFFGGQRWIRTTEDRVGRFTVCSLWPLGNLPVTYIV